MECFQFTLTSLGKLCGRRPKQTRDLNYQIEQLEHIIEDLKDGTGEFKRLSIGVHVGRSMLNELSDEWNMYRTCKFAGPQKKKSNMIREVVNIMNGYFTTVGVVAALILSITTPLLIQKTEFSTVVTDVWANNTNYDVSIRSHLNIALVAMMNASSPSCRAFCP